MKNDQRTITLVDDTTTSIATMVNNVRRAIVKIKERIRKQTESANKHKETNVSSQLNPMMPNMLLNQTQVAEVYSPPRVAEMANITGMRGGWSLDLTTCDADGMPWDFDDSKMRNRAARKLFNDKPIVLIGSPMCTEYSAMSRIHHCRMAPEVVKQRMDRARKQLEFCIKLHEIQMSNGRYLLHGHPNDAGPWQETMMKKLVSRQGVQRVVGDQCQFGLKSKDEEGIALARKRKGS